MSMRIFEVGEMIGAAWDIVNSYDKYEWKRVLRPPTTQASLDGGWA